MRKIILALAFVATIGTAYASSEPAQPERAPVPQNITIGNNANEGEKPQTFVVKDADGKIVSTLEPGASTGIDPAKLPITIEVSQ